jgi:myo-inositol-1(or 4)-monophosphatase
MNTDPRLPEYLEAAVDAARAGAALLESWRGRFTAVEKARADMVTEADNASQAAIREALLGRFPNHLFLGEEECVGKPIEATRPPAGAPPVWVVDPLDGTANYVHDVPAYCVSIGLVIDGRPVVGVIFDPRMNELFTAVAGRGSYLNGKRMAVSAVPGVRDSMISTGFPSNFQRMLRNMEVWRAVSEHAQSLRRTGSTALNLAYVACGRFDAYWCYDNFAWDVAAGSLLVTEAGGTVTAADGAPADPFRPDILATNGRVHSEMLGILPRP